jgi:glycosyltransferase involved in cell wall biosynthesis
MKGLTYLLEAVASLRGRHAVELVVVGRLRENGPTARRISELGLDGSVRFVSGISEEERVELYCGAEVAVVPSLFEGFSLPAVEAMSCGTPLVATTGGALGEVVGRDGDTALLVPPGPRDHVGHDSRTSGRFDGVALPQGARTAARAADEGRTSRGALIPTRGAGLGRCGSAIHEE